MAPALQQSDFLWTPVAAMARLGLTVNKEGVNPMQQKVIEFEGNMQLPSKKLGFNRFVY